MACQTYPLRKLVIDQLDCNYTIEDSHFQISVPRKNPDKMFPDTCCLGETPLNNLVKSIEKRSMWSDNSVNRYMKSPQEQTSRFLSEYDVADPEAVNIHQDMAMPTTDCNIVNASPLMSLDPNVNKNGICNCRKLKRS